MTEDQWKQAAQARAEVTTLYPAKPVLEARRLLLDAYMLAIAAPPDLLIQFTAVPDNLIETQKVAVDRRVIREDFSFRVAPQAEAIDLLIALASYILALDSYLAKSPAGYAVASNPEKAWRVTGSAASGFLIPRSVARRPTTRKDRPDLGAFIHRVLPHHRILPDRIGAYQLSLSYSETELGRGAGELAMGGVLFSGLDLDCADHLTDERFRVSKVVCEDINQHVDDHLVKAHDDACAVLAYPELTIDPEQRARISRALMDRPWAKSGGSDWTVPIILAGSWHESEGEAWFNLATVFDGYGRVVSQHRKLFPFVDKQGRLEDIASGKVLTVLVTEDALIAFGVCRDFCERGGSAPNPYSLLDVDLFVIASYGDDKTMEGHFATARDVRTRFRSDVFVVQQGPVDLKDALGFILTPRASGEIELGEIRRSEAWTVLKIPPEKIDSEGDM